MGLLPFSGPSANNRVLKSGDMITGDLIFPAAGYIMTDSNGVRWRITVDISGTIVANKLPSAGNPIGLLLAITYS